VKVVFADTFYWAALTSTEDAAHERAMELSRAIAPDKIITTDEVLCEYLEKTRLSVTLTAWRRAARCSPGNPALGRACDYIRPGLRRMEHGRHVVFYRQAAGGIPVSRILRQRMLPERQSIGDEDNGS
jgi:hypothetical protein